MSVSKMVHGRLGILASIVLQNYQNFTEMNSSMICIVANGGGFKFSRNIYLNTQCPQSRTSYRNGRNTEALIIENLEPVEVTKKLFQHHLNILKMYKFSKLEGCGSIIKPATPILILKVKWP